MKSSSPQFSIVSSLLLVPLTWGLSIPPRPPSLSLPLVQSDEVLVVSGIGLPSLESLGLTSEDLFDQGFQENSLRGANNSPILKRWAPFCGTPRGNVAGTTACANYLTQLNTTSCAVTEGGTIMCQAIYQGHRTTIWGFGVPNSTSSYCRDVASAVWWVKDNCATCPDELGCFCGGYEAAWGNGNLIVVTSGDYQDDQLSVQIMNR